MCQVACPVTIDTGALMKELRARGHGRPAARIAVAAAEHFGLLAAGARLGLAAASAARALPLGGHLVQAVAEAVHGLLPGLVPKLPRSLELPRPAHGLASEEPPPLPGATVAQTTRGVVYFPSCLTRIVGPLPGENGVPPGRAMRELLRWAGYSVRMPEGAAGLCCGMAFASKGYPDAARAAARRTAEALWRATSGGRLSVVTDASPCAGTLVESVRGVLRETGREIRTYDFPGFWAREVLPGLQDPPRRPGPVVIHPTCTLLKHGGLDDLLAVARAHAESVTVPSFAECCGFAGDKGFLVPELTASATATEAAEVRSLIAREPRTACYSTCRTCEIGLSRAVARPFGSLVALVHEAVTRA